MGGGPKQAIAARHRLTSRSTDAIFFLSGRVLVAHFNAQSPIVGLVAEERPAVFPPEEIEAGLRDGPLRAAADALAIQNATGVLGCFVADAGSLRTFADAWSQRSDINTDDWPIVTLRAPRFVYRTQEPPYRRLAALLAASSVDAERLTGDRKSVETQRAFWRARDLYLSAADPVSGSRERNWALLLEAVRTSHDFRPAYAQVMSEAIALAGTDRPGAVALLDRLIQANPTRMEGLTLQRQILARE